MEGGLLIHAAWLLSAVFVFVYRRWFETVAPRVPAFEAECAAEPALAVLSVPHGSEAELVAHFGKLAPRGEIIATLGGWPWVHYVLRVQAESAWGTVTLRIVGCRVLRTHEARPTTVTALVDELRRAAPGAVAEAWLHAGTYVDVTGRLTAPHGWRLASAGDRPKLEVWSVTPAWAAAGPQSKSCLALRTASTKAARPSPTKPSPAGSW
jgi:hypothetical protein